MISDNTGSSSTTVPIEDLSTGPGVVEVSSRAALRNSQWRRRLLVLLLLLLLVLGLACAAGVYAYLYYHPVSTVCSTPKCIKTANNILQSMNESVSACDDFYTFACGRWGSIHQIPDTAISNDWFSELNDLMARRILGFLEQNVTSKDPVPIKSLRQMFRACSNTDVLDRLGLTPMMSLLADIGLPLPSYNLQSTSATLNLTDILTMAKLILTKDLLLTFEVQADSGNRTLNRLTIAMPVAESPLPGSHNLERRLELYRRRSLTSGVSDSRVHGAYVRYMSRVMHYAYSWNSTRASKDHEGLFLTAARRVQHLEAQMYRAMNPETYDITSLHPERMRVAELQQILDNGANGSFQLNLKSYMEKIYKNIPDIFLDLDGRDRVIVYNVKYFEILSAILTNTNKQTILNYLWWQVVETLQPHLDHRMRDMKHRYVEEATGKYIAQPRSMFCATVMKSLLGMAVSRFFATPQFFKETKPKIQGMLDDVKWAFSELVKTLDWMDARTKKATLRKAEDMDGLIGFPEWLLNNSILEEYYDIVRVDEKKYLFTILDIRKKEMISTFSLLRATNHGTWWATDPMDVNAFHTFQTNTITIPAGLLQFPFYDLGLEALNYGALGSILGHELTHGFDDKGRHFDNDGNQVPWWTERTAREFVNKSECFVQQYSNYYVKPVHSWVDGTLTLGENIADNGGLREALLAYRRFLKRNGDEKRLIGLEKYTNEQLFFLSFANVWCSSWTKQSLLFDLANVHSPNMVRVHATLANMPQFANAWSCSKGSPMNPNSDKCVLF